MAELTQDRLKQVLNFSPEEGIFTWRERARGRRLGRSAGSIDPVTGYRVIRIDGVEYYAQRLAWFWVHGDWPRRVVFQNGSRSDIRIANLADGRRLTTKYDFKTKEGRAAYAKDYRQEHRERFADYDRLRSFGITRQQYAELFHAQNGVCAICAKPETQKRMGHVRALAVDHDHETGAVRGLLCVACNTGIGKLGEDRDVLLAAIRYLDKHSGREAAKPLRRV